MNPFPTISKEVSSEDAFVLAARCIAGSRWVEITPLPFDKYRVTIKDEGGAKEILS